MTDQEHTNDIKLFGMWVYLMSDCVLFAGLFAVYAVLGSASFGGPTARELFSLPYALVETLVLLTSSFTCGLAVVAARHGKKNRTLLALGATLILGTLFVLMEVSEFSQLVENGNSWHRSAFLSSFFTLVGTHGLHVTLGLIWLLTLIITLLYRGVTPWTYGKLQLFSLFWHFLDIVWVCIFTFVYLFGVL